MSQTFTEQLRITRSSINAMFTLRSTYISWQEEQSKGEPLLFYGYSHVY